MMSDRSGSCQWAAHFCHEERTHVRVCYIVNVLQIRSLRVGRLCVGRVDAAFAGWAHFSHGGEALSAGV